MVALQPVLLALFRCEVCRVTFVGLRQGSHLARLQFRIGQGYASYVIAEAGKDAS